MYTIDSENNITALAANEAPAADAVPFDSESSFAEISKGWQMTRFTEIWNGLPGEAPRVKKFENRAKAAKRIFARIADLGITEISETYNVELRARRARLVGDLPVVRPAKESDPKAKSATVKPVELTRGHVKKSLARRKAAAAKAHKVSRPKVAKPKTGGGENKKDMIVRLASRAKGATLDEIMEATEWQRHSVRGAIATLGKTMKIVSTRTESGQRHYQIA